MSHLLSSDLQRKCRYAAAAFLLGVVLLAGSVTPGYAVTFECIPESCPCDPEIMAKKSECVRIKTDDCCKPPPCDFYQAIVLARASRNVDQKIQQEYGELVGLVPMQDYKNYLKTRSEELAKEHAKCSSCPDNYLAKRPYFDIEVESNCEILLSVPGGPGEPASLEEVKENSNACSEVVEADYAQAQKEAEFCDQLVQANPEEDLSTYLSQEVAGEEALVQSLEASLWKYYNRCTDVLGSKMQREVADKGIDALIDKALPKPPPKKAKPKKSKKKKTKPAKRG